MKEVEPEIPFW